MRHGRHLKAFLLPLKNFQAGEIPELQQVCSHSLERRKFAHDLDVLLERLLRRQKPKRSTDSSKTYLIDDQDRHFEYGKERHARCETGHPHIFLCAFKRDFRFGVKIEEPDRHYNVSLEQGSMKGRPIVDCHGSTGTAPRDTHVNLFPSGFFC